ncbi:MAG: 2OG-Fe(II) oxygenase [Granulosicoccus sp.]|nr:2OG-Fe(II) oxygenase [Granulosicoccus sp.]
MSPALKHLDQYVNLHQYPVHDLDSDSGHKLLATCHEMMRKDTLCALPDFLSTEAIKALTDEVTALENTARKIDFLATPYGWMQNSGFPATHPRSQMFHRRCSAITTEQLDHNGLCMTLFRFDEITEFVRRLLGYETLYRSACPNISVRVNMMDAGDEFGWHYDTNDGVVSFAIQNADEGGVFEYAPLIRSEEDENYDAVAGIFNARIKPLQAHTPPGTFVLFMGRRSLHRVSPVIATSQCRHSLLFSYDRKPGMVFPENIRKRLTEPTNQPFHGLA